MTYAFLPLKEKLIRGDVFAIQLFYSITQRRCTLYATIHTCTAHLADHCKWSSDMVFPSGTWEICFGRAEVEEGLGVKAQIELDGRF